MKTAYNLLNEIAKQSAEADKMLDLIVSETPIDNTHYAQTEARRNTLAEVCKTIEAIFEMDAGQADLALKHACFDADSENTRRTNLAALNHFINLRS